jgi:hypothetical protein
MVDMKLEVVTTPVSDADRAEASAVLREPDAPDREAAKTYPPPGQVNPRQLKWLSGLHLDQRPR